MFALVIRAAIKAEVPKKIRGKFDVSRLKRRKNTYPIPTFENQKVFDYQLIESQVHHSLHLNIIKERAHPRAGP